MFQMTNIKISEPSVLVMALGAGAGGMFPLKEKGEEGDPLVHCIALQKITSLPSMALYIARHCMHCVAFVAVPVCFA